MPDSKMRSGDFSEFLSGSTQNPCGSGPSCTFTLGAPYVGNVLPAGLMDPFAKRLAALYPDASPGSLTYTKSVRNSFDEDRAGVRIDHRFSERDTIFGRYSRDFQVQHTLSWSDLLAPGPRCCDTHSQVLSLGETHVFRPNLINEASFGFNQDHPFRLTNAPNRDLYTELALGGIPNVPGMPTGLFEFHGNPGFRTSAPSIDSYRAIPPQVALDETNGADAPGARLSAQWDFSRPDQAPEEDLNRVIWKSVKGADSEPPGPP